MIFDQEQMVTTNRLRRHPMRYSYKTVLRTKGIRPIPAFTALRSSLHIDAPHITSEGLRQQVSV